MSDFDRWRLERQIDRDAARAVRTPQPQRSTVESDVLVPLLQGAALGVVGGLSAGTLTALIGFGRVGWDRVGLAATVGGGGFVFVLAGATVKLIFDHHTAAIVDPIRMAWERLLLATSARRAPPG